MAAISWITQFSESSLRAEGEKKFSARLET